MQRAAFRLAFLLAAVALTACTPFFYGGVVLIGPGEDKTPQAAPAGGVEQREGNQ